MESLTAAIDFIGGPAAIWILASVYFSSVILERKWALRGNRDYSNIDALCSIGLNLMSSIINILIGVVLPLAVYVLVYDKCRIFDGVPLLVAIPLAFVVHDLSYYSERC